MWEEIADVIHRAMGIVTSADKAYQLIRAWGYDVTRATVREGWKQVGMREAWATVHETWAERYGYGRKPPSYWTSPGPSGMRTEYQMLLEVRMISREGRESTRYVSYATNELTSWQNVMAEMEETVQTYAEITESRLAGVFIGGIIRRG